MKYSKYKEIAQMYVLEQKGTLDVLKIYNKLFEDEIRNYMLKKLLENCPPGGNEIKKAKHINDEYLNCFIREFRG